MNTPLTELQQFFGGYFHQDWTEEHSSADEVINSFLLDSNRDAIITIKKEILKLISSYTNESDLRSNLLHKQHCYYYYPHQWASGLEWLNHIIGQFDEYLLKKENLV
ncbi:contact-dependent growth inhibition system immunity protein [Pseudomonas cedrina]|uniref:contact-dependent growth inhibition system immunity protein n=1 Tax=Pseudomonas cedrina TaxID=651740 RepID=UPI003ED943E8